MKLSDFEFDLSAELIAQKPIEPRDHSKLMVIDRKTGNIKHDYFYNLPNYLSADDLLVFNQSKVFPARLFGRKVTGGKVEVLLTKSRDDGVWEFISHPGLKSGQEVFFDEELRAVAQDMVLNFNLKNKQLMDKIYRIGQTPLPPYISAASSDEDLISQRDSYQTVYAKIEGSVAAPTAGFHFTPELLEKIPNKSFVTLHVGLGTFLPVKTENIEDHQMHSERYLISPETLTQIKAAKRIIAVGTTSVRTLESWAQLNQLEGETSIFIYPGYKFNMVDAMITNFHLPKSTLLMLVSAFAGKDLIKKAYQEAILHKYRFYSFGDAMLIL